MSINYEMSISGTMALICHRPVYWAAIPPPTSPSVLGEQPILQPPAMPIVVEVANG